MYVFVRTGSKSITSTNEPSHEEKTTLWTLRNVSTVISPRRLIWADTFRLRAIGYNVMIPETENPLEVKRVSVRVSLRGMLRLIRVDTLRRVHNVGYLVIRFINNLRNEVQCRIPMSVVINTENIARCV